jgi:hypothetical protein
VCLARSGSFTVLTGPLLCCLQSVSALHFVTSFSFPYKSLPRHSSVCECYVVDFFSGLLTCSRPFLCLQKVGLFLVFCFFFEVFIPFLGTSAHIRQTVIVLLQCAVIMFLFYLDFTNRRIAPTFYIY